MEVATVPWANAQCPMPVEDADICIHESFSVLAKASVCS